MKKRRVFILMIGSFLCLLSSCVVESSQDRKTLTESGLMVYYRVETGLEAQIRLFENGIRMGEVIYNREEGYDTKYFAGETVFQDLKGWWGVVNWNGCRFKVRSWNEIPFDEQGSRWTALSEYSFKDSIIVECINKGEWVLKGYAQDAYALKTQAEMKVTCDDVGSAVDWDSVAFHLNITGTSILNTYDTDARIQINFSTRESFLRKERTAGYYYPFMKGKMSLEVLDITTKRKEYLQAQIESLPMGERDIQILSQEVSDREWFN